jgi:hypothetical protein
MYRKIIDEPSLLREPGMIINRTSLSQTVDAINAAHFSARSLPAAERGQAARWIAGRQGLPGAGVEVCGAGAGARGARCGTVSGLRTTPV